MYGLVQNYTRYHYSVLSCDISLPKHFQDDLNITFDSLSNPK